jgi:hypothetical protein
MKLRTYDNFCIYCKIQNYIKKDEKIKIIPVLFADVHQLTVQHPVAGNDPGLNDPVRPC